MSRRSVLLATLVALPVLGGCATKGFVRNGLAEQRSELVAQLDGERAAREAGDAALRADLVALRRDLEALRTEFGAKISALDGKIAFAFPVHFDFDDATVRPGDAEAIRRFAEVARSHYAGAMITVEGFADPAGSRAYNKQLSQQRAESVLEALVREGIAPSQLAAIGYGSERQVRPGAMKDAPGAELNRRVVFVVETPAEATVAVLSGTE